MRMKEASAMNGEELVATAKEIVAGGRRNPKPAEAIG
jgi:hypothetical protein